MSGLRVISGIAWGAGGTMCRAIPRAPSPIGPKESLFNIVGGDIEEAAFLDLFAGTGSVGIEALSRGASFARFIDFGAPGSGNSAV